MAGRRHRTAVDGHNTGHYSRARVNATQRIGPSPLAAAAAAAAFFGRRRQCALT